MREDVAKFWKYEDLKNDKFLYWRLVKSFWKMNVQFFKFLKDAEFYEFSKEYNAKRKKNLASIFSDKKSASPMSMSQARLIKSLEREEHQTKYGSDFTSDADRVQCVSSFQSFGKRLFKNGYSREKIIELLDISCNFEEKTSI